MPDNKLTQMHPRDQIILIMNRIYKRNLTTTSGGNISVMDEYDNIWVTPSGVDKGSLTPGDIICIKKDGSIEGPHKPSMEYPFHKAVYECRPNIKAIVHAHPPSLVSFSIVRKKPNTNINPLPKQICGTIGYAKYFYPGSDELGLEIANQFAKGFSALIMENHGAVVGGSDLFKAYECFEILEFCARTLINSNIIGTPHYLSDKQIDNFNESRSVRLPEMENENLFPNEHKLRKEITEIIHRACNHGLMSNLYGTVSVRLKDNHFLVTPTDKNRWDIQPEDVVAIKGGKRESGKNPSCSTWIHQMIYENQPDIQAIIITQPEYLMAYGATHTKLDVKTIPESWIFLQDIENVPFESIFRSNNTISRKVSKLNPGVIIENSSVLMTGTTLLQAYDRLEIAEFSAKSLIKATSLGQFEPMSDDEIDELREHFF